VRRVNPEGNGHGKGPQAKAKGQKIFTIILTQDEKNVLAEVINQPTTIIPAAASTIFAKIIEKLNTAPAEISYGGQNDVMRKPARG
jgi:hypothetical protein